MSDNYFQILEMGNNDRNFHFRHSEKMSENEPRICENVRQKEDQDF